MKKLLFILSVISWSFAGNAQKVTREEARFLCAEIMANFTHSVAGVFKEVKSYEEFEKQLCGESNPTEAGRNQLRAAFELLSKGSEKDDILKSYQGVEIAASMKVLQELNSKGISSDGSELFGATTGDKESALKETDGGCKWYQLWCHVKEFANWVVENWDTIEQIIIFIINSF